MGGGELRPKKTKLSGFVQRNSLSFLALVARCPGALANYMKTGNRDLKTTIFHDSPRSQFRTIIDT